jgi:hypothetical protein
MLRRHTTYELLYTCFWCVVKKNSGGMRSAPESGPLPASAEPGTPVGSWSLTLNAGDRRCINRSTARSPASLCETVKAVLPYTLLLQTAAESLDNPVLFRGIWRDELLCQPRVSAGSSESPALEDQSFVTPDHRRFCRRGSASRSMRCTPPLSTARLRLPDRGDPGRR